MKRNCILLFLVAISIFSSAQEIITMRNDNGIYTIPCTVNGLKLRFIFDTGAADVSISATEALFMLKNEYLSIDDIVDNANYTLADGTILENTIINISEIKIGSKTLTNVRACVVKNVSAPLLLGQSVIKELGPWYIDGDKLIFGKPSEQNSSSIVSNTPIEKCIEEAKKYESYGDYVTAIDLFKKACSVKDYASYYEFTIFCSRNRYISEDVKRNIPYDYICQAALDGYLPMIDFLKIQPDLFDLNEEKALRCYSDLILQGNFWFLCKSASHFCLWKLKNRIKGLEFILLGAEHDDPESIAYLAHLHSPSCVFQEEQNLVKQDKEHAINLYKKAIELGKMSVLRDCAVLLLENKDKKEDYELAMSYLRKAGEHGDVLAMMDLMDEYFYGEQENLEKALYWGNEIVKDSKSIAYNYAMSIVGTIYYIQDKQDEAFTCLRTAHLGQTKSGIVPTLHSLFLLAECYYYGIGTYKDYSLAYKYYKECIEQDNNIGTNKSIYIYNRLARLYENGLGVTENINQAFNYYMKAANYGDAFAQSCVANSYFEGEGTYKDVNKAIFWWEKSAQQGHAYSWYSLGWIYARERYGYYNTTKAIECFNKAVECDEDGAYTPSCYYELGMIYEYGAGGVAKSYFKAGNYYKKAAELGHDKAKEKMKEFE